MSSYNKFSVIAISGTSTIHVMDLSRDGQITQSPCAATAPGRILSFRDDFHHNMGTIMNIDEGSPQCDESKEVEGFRLFQFPFTASSKDGFRVAIYALKMLKFFSLLPSAQNRCVAPDSVFNVMQANRWNFEKDGGKVSDKNGGASIEESDNDQVRIAFPDQETCTVLICSSLKNDASCIFPIYKTRVEG